MTITSKSASLNHLRSLIIDRNQRETLPFVSIHQANAQLLNQLDALQSKYDAADREISSLRHQIQQVPISKASAAAASASLKNEARLRDKLEQLQDEYNARLKTVTLEKEASIKMSKDLAAQKDVTAAYEKTIQALQLDATKLETAIAHLQQQVKDGQEVTKLAEQQYDGLKLTIRHLQTENEELQKENRSLQERLLADKGQLVEEMNGLNELVEALKMEVEMLRSYKTQEDQRKNYWFGGIMSAEGADAKDDDVTADSRKFGSSGVIVPCAMKQTIPAAHSSEGMCLRYDPSGSGLFATSSSDATVKVWDSGTGSLRATLRGAAGAAIIGCDMSGSLAVGGGSDKTCRVWNIRTQRMVS
jgi:autophagy-related protein 16